MPVTLMLLLRVDVRLLTVVPAANTIIDATSRDDHDATDAELDESLPAHQPVCITCGDAVPFDELRAHLAEHHPGAWAFDTEQVWACFEVAL